MSDQLFTTPFATGAPTSVDHEKGIIYGAKIIQVGEAKGHGLFVDSEFIDKMLELGNGLKQGVKARFGHPNMCSTTLGTFLGRWKGLYRDGDAIRGNLFLSTEAAKTPNGDLRSYVLGLADNEPDVFGVSIDFSRDLDAEEEAGMHEETGLQLARIKGLSCADVVDSPAASDGMFSRFSGETVAGQITTFLDEHQDVWETLQSNPSIFEALARYGDKMDEFTTRYREYRQHNKEGNMPKENEQEATELAAKEAEALKLKEKADKDAAELATKKAEEATELAEKEEAERLEAERLKSLEGKTFDVAEFGKITEEFGAEIATKTALEGGDHSTALQLHADALKAENEALSARVTELEASGTGTPAKVGGVAKKAVSLFKSTK
jgi:hypothetical protein